MAPHKYLLKPTKYIENQWTSGSQGFPPNRLLHLRKHFLMLLLLLQWKENDAVTLVLRRLNRSFWSLCYRNLILKLDVCALCTGVFQDVCKTELIRKKTDFQHSLTVPWLLICSHWKEQKENLESDFCRSMWVQTYKNGGISQHLLCLLKCFGTHGYIGLRFFTSAYEFPEGEEGAKWNPGSLVERSDVHCHTNFIWIAIYSAPFFTFNI